MDLQGKKVTVVGLARSGTGSANLLVSLGADVTVTDKKSLKELKPFINKLNPAVKIRHGEHPTELFEDADLIVVSPGIPLNIPPFKKSLEAGIKVIGELELAYQIVKQRTEFLAITGTNGKSTTTTVLYEMIKNSGSNVIVGGNIGKALTEEILNFKTQISNLDYIVAEVSSFQLETIDEFKPKGSAILNITPDHLDRYHTMDEYIEAKCRIFMNQGTDDFIVLNADDPITETISEKLAAKTIRPEIFFFSRQREVKGAYTKDGIIYFSLPDSCFTFPASNLKIKGVHNIENAMAASLMALMSGCSLDVVEKTLETFSGLEHRLEFVREIDGIKFINDSKGTNVGAVLKSIESFNEPVILIAGGRDKDGDFTALKPLIKNKVKSLVLIGEAKEKIKKAVGNAVEIFMEDDFKSAILKARQLASPGDVVLLSPACASFDMFKDFEDRGRQFKRVVMSI